jgi:hypothetical protein
VHQRGGMMDFKKMFELWIETLKKPKKTFSAEKKHADFGKGAINILIAGVIAGIFYTVTGGAVAIVSTPIGQLIGWVILGGLIFLFAKMFGGKGKYVPQIYLMSLFIAPLMIVSAILSLIPVVGGYLAILVLIYWLYLLTLALKEAHDFSMLKAFLSWFVPILVLVAIMLALVGMALNAFMSSGLLV